MRSLNAVTKNEIFLFPVFYRYEKTIKCSISYFLQHDLDTLYLATNAPGQSAINRVERRMAPLCHDLAGVVLPHNTYGTHLDERNETVDKELELKIFSKAAEIWSMTVIDGYDTVAEYIPPGSETSILIEKDQEWHAKHVHESQYLLQIVKCGDQSCCSPRRSSLFRFLHDGFLPPPLPIVQGKNGLEYGENKENSKFLSMFTNLAINKNIFPPRVAVKFPKGIPYDFACPTVEKVLPRRVCAKCGLYFATTKSNGAHKAWCSARLVSVK